MYRVYSPDAISFPTLTATGSPDFISLESFEGEDQDTYNKNFIDKIYKQEKYRSLTDREVARLQGFPDSYQLCTQGNAKKLDRKVKRSND